MEDFQESTFEYNGLEKTVYKLGGDDKPAVLLLLEIPDASYIRVRPALAPGWIYSVPAVTFWKSQ